MYVSVCLYEREREKGETDRQTDRQRERGNIKSTE